MQATVQLHERVELTAPPRTPGTTSTADYAKIGTGAEPVPPRDREHKMTCLERAGVAGLDWSQVRAVQFQHGDVGASIPAREDRGDRTAVGQRDFDPVLASERVRSRDDDAMPPDYPT